MAPAGPGYFLVGDAAAVLDPASSHGVLNALMSGMMAGHVITQILRYGHPEQPAQRAYCAWLRRWFAHDVKYLKALYRRLPNPPAWV
jgi:flavin-dependent dehydrogenase